MKVDLSHIDMNTKHGQAALLGLVKELVQKVNDLEKENQALKVKNDRLKRDAISGKKRKR